MGAEQMMQRSFTFEDQDDVVIFRDPAFEQNKRHAIHRWVPWIAGFSADFVVDALRRYLPNEAGRNICVLDPFAGVGTTLVESIRHGYNAIGFEINPFAALAARVKCTAFLLDPASVRAHIVTFEQRARRLTKAIDQAWARGDDLARLLPAPASRPPAAFRSRVPFFSPAVERKVLHCLDLIHAVPDPQVRDLMLLAFGSILVHVSNYSYEPSLGSRSAVGKADVLNADVAGLLSARLYDMEHDIIVYRRDMMQFQPLPEGKVINDDSRQMRRMIPDSSIDIVITSPPYLNNYHYIRNTRPHLFWLNFVSQPSDLKRFEEANFGKYWQTVRDKAAPTLLFHLADLDQTIEEISSKNQEKGVYGGRGWANYVIEYFNDCYHMNQNLYYVLKPGARAVFVVGNSIIQGINVRTDQFLGRIGEICGLEVETIHTLREKRVGNSIINSSVRNGKSCHSTLYEAAVVMRKPAL
jgi:SAM-dependent methyltransferase